jgi:LPXTG-site transpeptidase (sortase) family protein
MKKKYLLSFAVIFIIGGLVLGYRPFMNWWEQHQTAGKYGPSVSYKVDPTATESNKLISGEPTKIDIPSVNISIPVTDGFYIAKSKAWTLSLDKAQYATITPQPNNQGGNTFIYGHNRWEVFYRLPKIKMGDEAVITTKNNHKFVYKLSSVKTTNPNDVSLFTYKGDPILTLQTCTGLWYQNRTLFSFQLVKVS